MTVEELEKGINSISLSNLSDKEVEKLYRVLKPFYRQLKVTKDYREYCNKK